MLGDGPEFVKIHRVILYERRASERGIPRGTSAAAPIVSSTRRREGEARIVTGRSNRELIL